MAGAACSRAGDIVVRAGGVYVTVGRASLAIDGARIGKGVE
jgi:hypothetical protein